MREGEVKKGEERSRGEEKKEDPEEGKDRRRKEK